MRSSIHQSDKAFFIDNPYRQFRVRRYHESDALFPPTITLFADDGDGLLGEINFVVVKHIIGARLRLLFAVENYQELESDRAIRKFLRARGIDPLTFKRRKKP